MKKVMKNRMVPKLRFAEFREEQEWQESHLGDLSKILRGGSPRPIDSYLTRELDGLNWLKIGDVDKESKYITNTEEKVEKSALSMTREVSPGDLIMSNSMSFGRPYILKINSCIHDGWIAVTEILIGIDKDYLYYFILSENSQLYFLNAAAGGGIKNLNADIVKLLPVQFPKLPEQQKIADCLTTLDDLISAQAEKVKALQAHKKGLMQQLFPAEGETVPRVRFGEFEGEWEEKKFGDLIQIKGRIGYRGYTVEDIVKEGEGAIALSPSNINEAGALSFEKSTYISWYKYEESPEIMLETGQTILVKTGSSYGKAAFIQELPEKSTINPQLVVFKPVKVNGVFLFLLVCHNSVQKQIKETIVGGAIPTLSQDSISKFNVLCPSKEEQQKIATCLTSLDDLIAAQGQKLEALRWLKKGLMQQLFPNTNSKIKYD